MLTADRRRKEPREVPRPSSKSLTADQQRAQFDARANGSRRVAHGHAQMLDLVRQRQGLAPVATQGVPGV